MFQHGLEKLYTTFPRLGVRPDFYINLKHEVNHFFFTKNVKTKRLTRLTTEPSVSRCLFFIHFN